MAYYKKETKVVLVKDNGKSNIIVTSEYKTVLEILLKLGADIRNYQYIMFGDNSRVLNDSDLAQSLVMLGDAYRRNYRFLECKRI